MNQNIKKILKEKLIRCNNIKKELLSKILKSIVQNNNIAIKKKIYANYVLNKRTRLKNATISKKNKICLATARRHGMFKNFSFCRHKIKELILMNKFTNIKNFNK